MNDTEVAQRVRRIWELHDFGTGSGLEIGPLSAAIVPRDRGDVRYADVYPRDRLVAHYRTHEIVDTERIPEIDFPLWDGSRMRTLAEAAKPGAPFDWVVASHVIEHVPDVVGWLQQIEELVGDGALVLAVPDRRYCFDAHRPPTTVGQMLQAHDDGDTIPPVRAVYDNHRAAVQVDPGGLWNGVMPGRESRVHSLAATLEQVQRARNGEYVDCHVWLFTPDSFVETIDELRLLGLCTWAVEKLTPTPRNGNEFFALLRRAPRSGTSDQAGDPHASGVPAWLVQPPPAQEIADLRADLEAKRARIRRLRRRLRRAEERIASMEGSRRWRVGGLATAPLAALRRRRRS